MGEAPRQNGVGVHTAVDDVLQRSFAFVEVQRLPRSTAQHNSLSSVFNYHVPAAGFFRVFVGAQGFPGCLPEDRRPVMQAKRKGRLRLSGTGPPGEAPTREFPQKSSAQWVVMAIEEWMHAPNCIWNGRA